MPRKGRLVQPRHIFPWVAAPYIEMLRILWRIERLFFMPIKYLRAWTVSAVFGVLGVLFSVALFIPRLAETQAQASPEARLRAFIHPSDLPEIPEDDLALPSGSSQDSLSVKMKRLFFKTPFDQNETVTTHSRSPLSRRSSLVRGDTWSRYQDHRIHAEDIPVDSYIRLARLWSNPEIPPPQEYIFDPQVKGSSASAVKAPTLLIQKSVPRVQSLHAPLICLITVTNNGEDPVESAIVTERVSDISRVIDCQPPAQRSADSQSLIWNLSELQPNETRDIRITIQPDQKHTITQETEVEFSSAAVIAETMVIARPTAPSEPEPILPRAVIPKVAAGHPKLVLEFDPPHAVKVGEELEAYYTITNVGTADATGIRLLVEVPAELRHRYGELVEHKISRLAPNESRRALFAALAEGSGRLPLQWTLEAKDLKTQSDSEWLVVSAGPAPLNSAPVKSSIPLSQPALPADPTLSTLDPEPTPVAPENKHPVSSIPNNPGLVKETLPKSAPDNSLAPSLSGDVPPASFGPRPLAEPSSIPLWASPVLGGEPDLETDPKSIRPIDPVLAPDERPFFNNQINPPNDLQEFEPETPASPSSIPKSTPPKSTIPHSTIPSGGLMPSEGLDGVKPQ